MGFLGLQIQVSSFNFVNSDHNGGDATTINVSIWNFSETDIVINGH